MISTANILRYADQYLYLLFIIHCNQHQTSKIDCRLYSTEAARSKALHKGADITKSVFTVGRKNFDWAHTVK